MRLIKILRIFHNLPRPRIAGFRDLREVVSNSYVTKHAYISNYARLIRVRADFHYFTTSPDC